MAGGNPRWVTPNIKTNSNWNNTYSNSDATALNYDDLGELERYRDAKDRFLFILNWPDVLKGMELTIDRGEMVALVGLMDALKLPLIDCQSYTDNLARFGAEDVPRETYLRYLEDLRFVDAIPRSWREVNGAEMLQRLLD